MRVGLAAAHADGADRSVAVGAVVVRWYARAISRMGCEICAFLQAALCFRRGSCAHEPGQDACSLSVALDDPVHMRRVQIVAVETSMCVAVAAASLCCPGRG
jgi:hypothetical protein